MILGECYRLRGIAENSIRLSGELDVERMKRERMFEQQNYNNQVSQFKIQKEILDQEIKKLTKEIQKRDDEIDEWKG